MRTFLDSSVLVAAFYGDHEHHAPSLALLAEQRRSIGSAAAHCLAEVYSVLTGMPAKHRVSPHAALLFLGDVRERLTTIALDEPEYFAVLESAASAGLTGGSTYDAIIAHCVVKAKAQSLYTWNVRHFKRFGGQLPVRVREPGEFSGYTVQEAHSDAT